MGHSIVTWPILLGQMAESVPIRASGMQPSALMLIIPVVVALILVVGLPIALAIRAESRKREMEHLERMRAIELGRPLPGEAGWWSPARMAMGMGVGVPIGVFAIGWIAAESSGAAPFVWPSAAAVGVAGVICGTILAARAPAPRPPAVDPHAKPYVHPDAYDAAEHQHA